MKRYVDEDMSGAEFRECDLSRSRLIGVVMQDVVIDGLVTNLVVNDVEVTGYVEAELDRRHPVRTMIRADEPDTLRNGWQILRSDWARTIDRIRELGDDAEHRRVDDEWSAVETLRHLVFVHDSWFRRCVLGSTEPFHRVGLAGNAISDQEAQGLDPSGSPSLEEVLAVRDDQAVELEEWLSQVTVEQLQEAAPVPDDDFWPPYARGRSVVECLRTVLNEEWAHHGFCVRDLDVIASGGAG